MNARPSSTTAGKVVGGIFGALFVALWVLGWSAVTLTFDVVWVKSVLAQWRAASYPTAAGTVTSSRVRESTDSEGARSFAAKVTYAYDVGGRRYECGRYRHGVMGSGRRPASAVVASHPPGRAVTVYYNPADPSDAVLRPGVEAADWFMPLFFTPFNLVMLASWVFVAAALVRPLVKPPPAGVKVRHEGMILRLRPEGFPPVGAATIAAGLATVPCILIAGLAGGPDGPAVLVYGSWVVVLAVAGLVYFRTALPQWAGHIDLVIDPWRKTMTLPRTHGRTADVQVDFARLTGVEVEHRKTTDGDGEVTHHYLPTVRWTDQEHVERSAVLASWGDAERAERFAGWLRERVGMQQPAPGPTAPGPA